MNGAKIVVVDVRDGHALAEAGERLRRLRPLVYARLLALALRSVAIEEDPLSVVSDDLAAALDRGDEFSSDA